MEHNDKSCQDIAVIIAVTLFWASITLIHTVEILRGVFMSQIYNTAKKVWDVNIS